MQVNPKPAHKSMGFMGSLIAAGSAAAFVLPNVFSTPGQLTEWCQKVETKYGASIALVLGVSMSLFGNARRQDVIFSRKRLHAERRAMAFSSPVDDYPPPELNPYPAQVERSQSPRPTSNPGLYSRPAYERPPTRQPELPQWQHQEDEETLEGY